MARYTWADSVNVGTDAAPQWVSAGIRGDGRLRDGTPASGAPGTPSNDYEGGFCGVEAGLATSKGSNGEFNGDPDIYWTSSMLSSCGPARYFRFYVNGLDATPAVSGPHEIIDSLYKMAVGQVVVEPFHSGTWEDLGMGYWFDDRYPPAADAKITRLPDIPDPDGAPRTVRQWRVESQGSHLAMGITQTSTKHSVTYTPTGVTYYLPFVLTITEVPYPYPTYP
jgi:hypothetical protein